jgi:hypothetical protein
LVICPLLGGVRIVRHIKLREVTNWIAHRDNAGVR